MLSIPKKRPIHTFPWITNSNYIVKLHWKISFAGSMKQQNEQRNVNIIDLLNFRLFGTTNAEDTVEFELHGKKYDDMVEFLCCVYPDILNPITGRSRPGPEVIKLLSCSTQLSTNF